MTTLVRRLPAIGVACLWMVVFATAQESIILSADYGAGDRGRVDVTSQVQSRVRNRVLNLVVLPDALGVADPAYGTVKELWIRVRDFDGRINLYRYRDGETVNLRLPAYDTYQNVLAPEWQARFDSYFTRWQEYRRRRDRDEIESMEKRMRDIMLNYKIPLDTPFELVASARVAPHPEWSELRVEWANYGAGTRNSDVTRRLQGMVQNNSLQVRVGDQDLGGDPAPGVRKQLYVVYFYDGQRRQASANDGEYLRIP